MNKIKKVVFLGAPSTGKTTILKAAAAFYGTNFVLEYGREYWQQNQVDRLLSQQQLLFIAQEQIRKEVIAISSSKDFLFVDTNAFTTWHFAMDYYGCALPKLSALADQSKDRFDYVFLCSDEIPYEDTWERSGKVKRHTFQAFIKQELGRRKITYTYLQGTVQERLEKIKETLV